MNSRWIAVDWGTTQMRAFLLDDEGAVLARASRNQGMGALTPDRYEGVLLDAVGGWLEADREMTIMVAGMAGARQGWIEAPYEPAPGPPLNAAAFAAPDTQDARLKVRIVHGLAQLEPPEVMRGEETQIAGFLSQQPDFDGAICLPGTHSKWAIVAGGDVRWFGTAMTGEMFALLSEQSVLRYTTKADVEDDSAFTAAVEAAFAHPERLAAEMFGLRAGALLHAWGAPKCRGRLSGLLIGAELAAFESNWSGRKIAVIGAEALSRRYIQALAAVGAEARYFDVETATVSGLSAARAAIEEAS